MKINPTHASAAESFWRYPASKMQRNNTPPVRVKLSLLTIGMIQTTGEWQDNGSFLAWAPLIQRDKDIEAEINLHHTSEIKMQIEMKQVVSSQIEAMGHDPASETMRVQFKNGGMYLYSGVSHDIFQSIIGAESVGTVFSATIKKNPKLYPFTKEA